MKWVLNIASNYMRFGLAIAIMLVMTPYLISSVGIEVYGVWVLVFSIVSLVGLTDMGFATAAVKFLAEQEGLGDRDRRNGIAGALLLVYALIGLLCIALGLAAIAIGWPASTHPEAARMFLVLVSMTGCCMMLSVFRAALIAGGYQTDVNLVLSVASVGQALLTVVLLETGSGVEAIAFAHAAGMGASALVLIPVARRRLPGFSPRLTRAWRHDIRQMSIFSLHAFAANAAFIAIFRVDALLVESMASVALLGVAIKIAEQVLLFNKQFSNALMPLVSRLHGSRDHAGNADLLLLSTRYLFIIACPALSVIAVLADPLLVLWIGSEFREAAGALQIICVACLFSSLQLSAANHLGMTGQSRYVATVMVASALIKLVVAALLIPILGLTGAALGFLLAMGAVECPAMLRRALHSHGIGSREFLRRAMAPGLIAAAPAVAVATLAEVGSLIELVLLMPACMLIAVLTGIAISLPSREIDHLKTFIHSRGDSSCAVSTAP